MAQLERSQRQVETPKPPPTIHTMEQLLRAGEYSKSKQSPTYSSSSSSTNSSPSSPFFQRLRHHDSEEDHGQNQKKSVLTKVKEKAKKLRHSLSKRKHEDGNPTSPSSTTGVEGDGVEEDAEYLGAPMYESEKSPAGYEANVRQQNSSPRGNPVFPEKHVFSSSDKHVVKPDHQEKTLSRSMSKKTTTTSSPNATTSNINTNTNTNTLSGLNKTMTEIVAKKPTPVHVEKPDPSHITSKIQGLTVSKPTEHHDHTSPSSSSTTVQTIRNTSLSYAAPFTPPAKLPSQAPSITPRTTSAPVTPEPSSAPAYIGKSTSPIAQIQDKGVSMKEYLLNKLEPGEDEKALSQMISEAMSPRRTPGDAGVMEKVRQAVTSLLRTEEPIKYADTTTTTATATATATSTTTPTRMWCQSPNASRTSSQMPASTSASRPSSQMPASTSVSRSSSQIPVSFNAQQDYEVYEEENHGRILQAN